MIEYIPPPQNEKEKFTLSLEGQQFTIAYAYNKRADAWYLTLTKDSTNVLDNIKMVQGVTFGYNYVDFPLIEGDLYIYSPTSITDDPNKANFGKSVFLVYEPKS